MRTTPEHITHLEPYQVFVFGSNANGFHGAGAAGYACRGTAANTWRDDPWFQRAMKALVKSPDRIGKWAVYGVARGYQIGREGRSYAIETIQRPGQKRSTPLSEIALQIREMLQFARENPDLEFLVTPIGCKLAGYSTKEIKTCFDGQTIPENVVLPKEFL